MLGLARSYYNIKYFIWEYPRPPEADVNNNNNSYTLARRSDGDVRTSVYHAYIHTYKYRLLSASESFVLYSDTFLIAAADGF